ncbi:MAG: DUF2155 domain-containing protein [Ghiorsea sp.]
MKEVFLFNRVESMNKYSKTRLFLASHVQLLLIMCLFFLLTACDEKKAQEIEWQLPLSVPYDPHASNKGDTLPIWATTTQGEARFTFLQKSTARKFSVSVNNGDEVSLQHWQLHVQGLSFGLRIKDHTFINDSEVNNPAAFVALYRDGTLVYRGWLYQKFPELFGADNLDWKLWLEEASMPPSSQEGDNLLP